MTLLGAAPQHWWQLGFDTAGTAYVQITWVTRDGGETTPSHRVSLRVAMCENLVVDPPENVDPEVNGWRVYARCSTREPGAPEQTEEPTPPDWLPRQGDVQPLGQAFILDRSSRGGAPVGPPPPLTNTALRR